MINYCLSKVRLLQLNGVKPVLVFDGAKLKMKSRIEDDRKKQRLESLSKAEALLLDGNLQGANKKYIEAIEITNDMVQKLIIELKCLRIEYIVAPYEADAQLAHLFKIGKIDLVITEDSDLLLFGA